MRKVLLVCLSFGISFSGKAQFEKVKIEATDHLIKEASGLKPKPLESEFIGFRNPPSDDAQWKPLLTKVSKNESENDEFLEKLKEEKYKLRMSGQVLVPKAAEKTTSLPKSPVVSTNFAGISSNFTPLDNSIAISDKDTIVDFVNAQITYFSTSGVNIYSKSLYGLIGDNTLTNYLCDPKVIWDNVARRFIFYCQVCDAVSAHSKIVIGFSKTSNPMNGWYFYKFSGDPLGFGDWWDYPKMAVSNDELFVTGNLFNGTSFDQSVIMQIQKTPCYSGLTPLKQVWSGISGAFTILPVGYGQKGSYGPGIYAISSYGSSGGSVNYNFYDITNNIASGTAVLNTYYVGISNYSAPGNVPQKSGLLPLNTGDNRAQDGFYLKGYLHFVLNVDAGSGYCGFRYNRLDVKTLACGYTDFSNVGVSDYCYPAVASAVNDSGDNTVVMAFNETSAAIYPQTDVVYCDVYGHFSAPVVVKTGSNYVDYGMTGSERWGDYTGLCKRFGDPAASLWMAGMYGDSLNKWGQWIAKIGAKNVEVGNVTAEDASAKVFPNPISDRYQVVFNLAERQNVIINITDMSGRTVVELYNGIAEDGENNFSFEKGSMANGIYSLNIIGAKTNIKNEKIVISGK